MKDLNTNALRLLAAHFAYYWCYPILAYNQFLRFLKTTEDKKIVRIALTLFLSAVDFLTAFIPKRMSIVE